MFDDFEEDCWFDPEWLRENQLNQLTVIEYFKLSPFYQTTNFIDNKLTLEIKVEAHKGDNFIITKNLTDENKKTHIIGAYRIFDYRIFKGVNLKQYIQNQLSSLETNIDDILFDVRKESCWSDLKRKWELELSQKQEEKITLKEDFF